MTAQVLIFEENEAEGKLMQALVYYFGLFSEKGQRKIVKLLEFWLKYIAQKVA